MAWSLVQSNGNSASGVTSLAVQYASNVAAGNKLIASAVTSPGTISSVKDGAGNSFTQLATVTNSGAPTVVTALFALDVPAGDVGTRPTITVTVSTSAGLALVIEEVSGLLAGNTTAMLDGTAGTATGTTSPTANPTYSSTALNEYLVTVFGDQGNNVTYTVPATFTDDAHSINTSFNADNSLAHKNSTNGAETAQYTLNAGDEWATLMVAFKLAATAGVSGTVQPRPTVPVPRRVPARGAWRGLAVPGQSGQAPRQAPYLPPRRRLARAWVQFTPVRTVNATPPPPVSGTVQPRATVPVPRRPPGRGAWRGTAVPGIIGTAPLQQYRTPPRRALARAVWRGGAGPAPVTAAGGGRLVPIVDVESRLIRRYRRMLYRHGLPDWEPEVSMMAAPVAVQVPPGWPGTWPVQPPEPEPEPAPAPARASAPPAPKWRPVYTRPPKIVRARHVSRDAMMPVWRKTG